MQRRKYYVAVGTGEIVEDPSITAWEYEIEASEEEIVQLDELFDQANRQNMDVFYRVTNPIRGGKVDHNRHNYDETLQEIYRMIHRLGNAEAKQQIEDSNIIEEIGKNYK